MYNKDNTIKYMVKMLKVHGVRHIVASPGTQCAALDICCQNDPFFKVYSVVDERSAGYFATGLAFETGEPVAITCTCATADRNWMSPLTEAFHSNLPIIALAGYNPTSSRFNIAPQFVDRRTMPADTSALDVVLPLIRDWNDKAQFMSAMNAALTECIRNKRPVHISVPNPIFYTSNDFLFADDKLPDDIIATESFDAQTFADNADKLRGALRHKRIAVFIGAHAKFAPDEEAALSTFVRQYNAPVFVEHMSNYHGANKVLIARALEYARININQPDITIDIGGVLGNYFSHPLLANSKVWRIQPDGRFISRFDRTSKLFVLPEKMVFQALSHKGEQSTALDFFGEINAKLDVPALPELPLSTVLIAHELAHRLPADCSLHMAILNCTRFMNFFPIDESVDCRSNTGGFGIDGPLSTLVGQSVVNAEKLCFGIVGDLAFFYDMNILGNRHIGNNLRILLVNNGRGAEFPMNPTLRQSQETLDESVAAGGHFAGGAQGWATSCGLHYMSAKDKDGFMENISEFTGGKFDKSVVFEVFVDINDEIRATDTIGGFNQKLCDNKNEGKRRWKLLGGKK